MVGTHPLSFKPAELYVLFPQRHSLTVSVAVCNRLRLATCGTPAEFHPATEQNGAVGEGAFDQYLRSILKPSNPTEKEV